MKASKFSDRQKAFIIKQVEESTPIAEICRKTRISQTARFKLEEKICRPAVESSLRSGITISTPLVRRKADAGTVAHGHG